MYIFGTIILITILTVVLNKIFCESDQKNIINDSTTLVPIQPHVLYQVKFHIK